MTSLQTKNRVKDTEVLEGDFEDSFEKCFIHELLTISNLIIDGSL